MLKERNMKKVILGAVVLILLFVFIGCGDGGGNGVFKFTIDNRSDKDVTNIKVYETNGHWDIVGAVKYDSSDIIENETKSGTIMISGFNVGIANNILVKVIATVDGYTDIGSFLVYNDNPESGSLTELYIIKMGDNYHLSEYPE